MLDLLAMMGPRIHGMLNDPDAWETLNIDYHPPRVERLWRQVGIHRVFLHCIHPCHYDKALWHPHPWASVVHVLQGKYDMGVAEMEPGILYNSTTNPPKEIMRMVAGAGTRYTMTEKTGAHFVAPREKCYTLMIVGPPWGKHGMPQVEERPRGILKSLTNERKLELIDDFRALLRETQYV